MALHVPGDRLDAFESILRQVPEVAFRTVLAAIILVAFGCAAVSVAYHHPERRDMLQQTIYLHIVNIWRFISLTVDIRR